MSHDSNLDSGSAVAPVGPLVCFIHHASDGVSYPKLFHKQRPCRIWWFLSVSAVLSLPAGKKQISHSGNSRERERKRPLQEQGSCSLSLMGEILRNYGQISTFIAFNVQKDTYSQISCHSGICLSSVCNGEFLFQPCTRTNSRVRTAYTLRPPSVGRQCPDATDKEPCSLNLNCFNYFYNITGKRNVPEGESGALSFDLSVRWWKRFVRVLYFGWSSWFWAAAKKKGL